MDNARIQRLEILMARIAHALEIQAGCGRATPPEDWSQSSSWIWQAQYLNLKSVTNTGALPLKLLIGLDDKAKQLYDNTQQFAQGYSANNALLWGARGMGKSSLIKAIHYEINKKIPLILIEVYREDIDTLPQILDLLRQEDQKQFILFCDDFSFDENDTSYKSLKTVLEGGIETKPKNVIFYATSNRRHLIPRSMIENERSTAIHPGESIEEKTSLSDRFGLWLGFYPASQSDYLAMINSYADHYKINANEKDALEWSKIRGNRSGRTAWQYIQHLAGKQSINLCDN